MRAVREDAAGIYFGEKNWWSEGLAWTREAFRPPSG